MPFKMVRSDVDDAGHVRRQAGGPFQLEAGQFRRHPGILVQVLEFLAQGKADVPGYGGLHRQGGQHFAQQGGGGGLPVAAGYGTPVALVQPAGFFRFGDDFHAQVPGLLHRFRGEGDAGRDDEQMALFQIRFRIRSLDIFPAQGFKGFQPGRIQFLLSSLYRITAEPFRARTSDTPWPLIPAPYTKIFSCHP